MAIGPILCSIFSHPSAENELEANARPARRRAAHAHSPGAGTIQTALVEQSAAAAESLQGQAERLSAVVGTFRLGIARPPA